MYTLATELLIALLSCLFLSIHSANNQALVPSLGLSLKSQELTALFLAVRLFCSTFMEGDIHTVLDLITLVATTWVVYMIRFKLKSTYIKELDNLPLYYLVKTLLCVLLLILWNRVETFANFSFCFGNATTRTNWRN